MTGSGETVNGSGSFVEYAGYHPFADRSMASASNQSMQFVLLSNHGQALVAIAENPDVRLREIAERVGITERAIQSIVNDLVDAGYVQRTRVGRRNVYTVDPDKPFPHPALRQSPVRALFWGLVPWRDDDQQAAVAADEPPAADDPGVNDDGLDRLTALTGLLLHAPLCFVSLLDGATETIVSGTGVPEDLLHRELPLERSICRHVVAARAPLVVTDALEDATLRDHPAVTDHGLRSYAGLPLLAGDGSVLGSLCVADTRPRQWSQGDVRMLTSLAAAAASQVEIAGVSRRHQQSAERYRRLLDSLPEAMILVFDRDLRVEVASGGVVARSGRTMQELVGRRLEEIVEAERYDELRRHYEQGLAGDRHEFLTSPDGVDWFSIDIVPLRDGGGEVSGVMSVAREQLGFGREDQWDAARLRAVIENVPAAIYRSAGGAEWTMEFVSDHIEAITGYAPGEFVGSDARSYTSVIHPEDRVMVDHAIGAALAERRPFTIEYRVVDRQGTTRWVRERGQGLEGDDGEMAYVDGAIIAIDAASGQAA
jgi:PAS domain S-box-containing protein